MDREALIARVVDAVIDGAPIDWAAVERDAGGSATFVAHLRTLETLASVHRSAPPAAPVEAPTQWGHLRVLETIGSGASGQVYRAWDTRLDREVALKLLPAGDAALDGTATTAIEEGRLLARVRHPHVVTIYGAEQIGSTIGLWMEFVRGRTLEAIVRQRTALEPAETIDIGLALCGAVAAVHSAGLLHRDIKTHNVMRADDGRVVLMDFGTGRESAADTKDVAGTPLYLAPEIFAGQPAAVQSDVYSLGVLLFRLVTGTYPVNGRSVAEVRVAHASGARKSVRDARTGVPASLARIIERAIDPRPEVRYASAEALAADLRTLQRRPLTRRQLAGLAAGLVAIAAATSAVIMWGLTSSRSAEAPVVRHTVPVVSLPGSKSDAAISPDGRQVAFVWARDGDSDVHVKLIGEEITRQLTTKAGGEFSLIWSPDSQSVAFLRRFRDVDGIAKAAVVVVPALGGSEEPLWVGSSWALGIGLDWSPDGATLVTSSRTAPGEPLRLLLISRTGANARWLTSPSAASVGDTYPAFSPGGDRLAFVRNTGSGSVIYLMKVPDGEPTMRLTNPQDLRSLGWTADGRTLLFSSNLGGATDRLWTLAVAAGDPQPLEGAGEGASEPSTARQGTRLVFRQTVIDSNLYRVDFTAGPPRVRQLSASSREDTQPDISPDGSRIVFVSNRSGASELWTMTADGGDLRQITTLGTFTRHPRWSPDGRRIAFSGSTGGGDERSIFVVDAAGGPSKQMTVPPGYDHRPTWSADGRWIYFAASRRGAGTREAWKVPAAGGPVVAVTHDGGQKPWESYDGRFLYYGTNTPAIWRMPVGGGPREQVLALPEETGFGGEWVLTADGIYLLNERAKPLPAFDFLSFSTGRVSRIFTPTARYEPGGSFSVSADRRWMVFPQRDYFGSDIMMLESVPAVATPAK